MPWPGPTNTYASDEDPSTGWLFSISNGFRQGSGGLNPAADDFPAEGITPSGKGRATDYTPHKHNPGNNSTKGGPSRHSLTSTGEATSIPPHPRAGGGHGILLLKCMGTLGDGGSPLPTKGCGIWTALGPRQQRSWTPKLGAVNSSQVPGRGISKNTLIEVKLWF